MIRRTRPAVAVMALAGLACATLVLAACGDINPTLARPVGPTTGATGTASPTVTPTTEPGAKVGECFGYASAEHLVLDTSEPHISCEQPHTARTVYVGELSGTPAMSFADAQALLPQVAGSGGLSSLPADLQKKYLDLMAAVAETRKQCQATIDTDLGLVGPDGIRQASLFRADLTGPTPKQWDGGDRWVRCNLVAVLPGDGGPDTLVPFTDPLADLFTATAAYRPCWTGAPDAQRPLSCVADPATTGVWVTLTDQAATPTSPWPGAPGAASAAQAVCEQFAQRFDKVASPTVRSWGTTTQADGTVSPGFSADTWGTSSASIGCAVPLAEFLTSSG